MVEEIEWISIEDIEDDSEFWSPDEGEELIGTVISEPRKGSYDRYYLVVEDGAEQVWITTQCANLSYQIKKLKVTEGDYVRIIYAGQDKENNNAHKYELYKAK